MKAELNNDWSDYRTGTIRLLAEKGNQLAEMCIIAVSSTEINLRNYTSEVKGIAEKVVNAINNSSE